MSSAKDSFDAMNTSVSQGSAMLILLDRMMASYGPETQQTRTVLRNYVADLVKELWPDKKTELDNFAFDRLPAAEIIKAELLLLNPQDDFHRTCRIEAMQICSQMLQMRWFTIERAQISLPLVFDIVLFFWLIVLFGCFGLLTPANKTILTIMVVCGISIGGAIFLIEEMNDPMGGLIVVSKAPLIKAIEHMGM